MPHIKVDDDLPGIRALMAFRPETATPMGELANILLRSDEGITMAEREMIAAHVSYLNNCMYCHESHGAIAACYLNDNKELVDQVKKDYQNANISDKLKALPSIAASVQRGGKQVTKDQIENAKMMGASDREIHDTVLISAMFCMFNRYVDGLDANTPADLSTYPLRAKQIAEKGYGNHVFESNQPKQLK